METLDIRSKKLVLYILSSAGMVATLSQLIFLPSITAIREDLAATTFQVSMTIALYSFALAIAQLVYGPLVDKFKPKTIILTGLIIFALSSLGIFQSASIEMIIFFRIMQALGVASVGICGNSIISVMFTGVERDKSISIFQMFHSIGAAIGPAVGATIGIFFSWRISFLILTVWVIIVIAILVKKLPLGENINAFSFRAAYHLIQSSNLLFLCLAGAATAFVIQSFHTSLGFLFTDYLKIHAGWTGYAFMAIPLGVFTGSNINRMLLNFMSTEKITLIGMTCMTVFVGTFVLFIYVLPNPIAIYILILNLYLVGSSLGIVFATVTSIIISWFTDLRGTAIAVLFFTRNLFGTVGPLSTGYMIDQVNVPMAYVLILIVALLSVPLCLIAFHLNRRKQKTTLVSGSEITVN